MTKSILMLLFFALVFAVPARAQSFAGDRYQSCPPPLGCHQAKAKPHRAIRRKPVKSIWSGFRAEVIRAAENTRQAVLGGRPAGCPHRFCGCALSIRVFGHSVRDLWLASNWLRFRRTAPASGMVAARRGHVFQLLAHVGGSTWQVWDANSGRGRIRVHHRSIAGFSIVNPRIAKI